MRKFLLTSAIVLAQWTPSIAPAQAASIWPEKATCDTTEAGKSTACRVIHVEGEIYADDWRVFRSIAQQDKTIPTVVQLNSNGGNLASGLIMGTGIHELKFNTWVPTNGRCASVCAAMWVAGSKRLISESGGVGFHQSSEDDGRGHKRTSIAGNKALQKYYTTIGVPEEAVAFFLGATPNKVYWLNGALATGFDIPVVTVPDHPKEQAKAPEAKPQPEATIPQTKPGA
jgi:hypothetical protein